MRQVLRLVILGFAVALTPAHAPSCGGGEWFPEFLPDIAPNVPEGDFRAGRLGVVRPSLYIQHLAVAYRYLSGVPLTPPASRPFAESGSKPAQFRDPWAEWRKVRSQVTESPTRQFQQMERLIPGGTFQYYANCNESTIATATATLNKRIAAFGAADQGVKAWVEAQDVVFANCADGTGTPSAPESSLAAILIADRQYQIAAAHFYAGRFDEARAQWLRIAGDPASPWRDVAPYLAARCLIRKSTVVPGESVDTADIREAAEELGKIAKATPDREVRGWAESLLGYCQTRLEPYTKMLTLADEIRKPANDARFDESVAEFDYLYVTRSKGMVPEGRDDFADWIFAARGRMPNQQILEKWKQKRSLPWLLWALGATSGKSEQDTELVSAASAVDPASPAFATTSFHRVRLELEASRTGAARDLLDQLLPELRRTQPAGALNPFLEWRMALARDYAEFLRYAVRIPIGRAWGGAYAQGLPAAAFVPAFDADASDTFNQRLPASLWRASLDSPELPLPVRESLRRALWVRAILLDDHKLALAISPGLRRQHQELAAGLTRYEHAGSDEARRFEAALVLLQPGLVPFVPNNYDPRALRGDWCVAVRDREAEAPRPNIGLNLPLAPWLAPADRKAAAEETAKMMAQGTASDFLARTVITWAKAHPDDSRSPEALYRVVRATRFGCRDAQTGTYSKAAFDLLHHRYPNSDWAHRTKYWYSGPTQ